MKRIIVFFSLAVICFACEPKKTDEEPIARVGEEYLYPSDLVGIVNPGTLQADSIEAVQAYIHNWIQQNLLVLKAEKNLSDKQKKFEKEIENYRNSLIIFAYQSALVDQMLDTIVTQKEIEDYYENNESSFVLNNNIVSVRFVKLETLPAGDPKDQETKERIQGHNEIYQLMFQPDLSGSQLMRLSDLCRKYALNYYLGSDKWLYFNDMLKEVPVEVVNQEDFLKKQKMFEVPDGDYIYYVNILDYKLKGKSSPLSFEEEKIKHIILNNRKVRLIENLHNEVMREGQERGYFELY